MKKYATISDMSESDISSMTRRDSDTASLASSHRRFVGHKRINSALSEPLTTASSIVDESLGGDSADPYFVFRSDLQRKLESLDEYLADYLRIVHETVRSIKWRRSSVFFSVPRPILTSCEHLVPPSFPRTLQSILMNAESRKSS